MGHRQRRPPGVSLRSRAALRPVQDATRGGRRCPPTGSVRSRRPSSALDRGVKGEPTVGDVRVLEVDRLNLVLGGSVEEQVAKAVEVLADRGALHPWAPDDDRPVPDGGESATWWS